MTTLAALRFPAQVRLATVLQRCQLGPQPHFLPLWAGLQASTMAEGKAARPGRTSAARDREEEGLSGGTGICGAAGQWAGIWGLDPWL